MKKLIIMMTALMLGLFATGCDNGGDDNGGGAVHKNEVTKIVTIGDSINSGSYNTPWAVWLRQMTGVEVINNSKDGRTTGEGLGVVDGELRKHKPSHLCVLLGTNDAIRGDPDEAIRNLQAFIDKGNAAGCTVVIGTPPIIKRTGNANARSEEIANRIKSELTGANIADTRAEVSRDQYVDTVHPNSEGTRNIAMAFFEKL